VIEYAYREDGGSIRYPDSEGDLGHGDGYAQAIDPSPRVLAAFRAYAAANGWTLVQREVGEFEDAPQPLGALPVGSFVRTPRGAIYVRADEITGGSRMAHVPWLLVKGGGNIHVGTSTLESLGAVPISPEEVAA
jgi:hypothetical protein